MIKTLSQLKKDIQLGTKIQCIGILEADHIANDPQDSHFIYSKDLHSKPLNETMQSIRTVTKAQINSFALNGSYSNYPKASNLEYIDDTFTITEVDGYSQVVQKRSYKIIN